jgi:hypothetical protein
VTVAEFPWRPLGALLVERGLLTHGELEHALAEQRRSGRLLGQILVDADYLSGFTLTRALADQHGVDVRSKARPPEIAAAEGSTWRPLGRLLLEKRLVAPTELEQALEEQRQRRARLGEILVARGYLTGLSLARTLAEQHGLDATPMNDVETAVKPDAPAEPLYEVWKLGLRVYATPNFLDAADVASELVQDGAPNGLVIQKTRGDERETVWTYSDAAARKTLVETFGFDPTRWSAR